MEKKELKALENLKELADELRVGITHENLFATNEDGSITDDAFAWSNRVLHLLDCIHISWEQNELKWFDFGDLPSAKFRN